jgi:hypothetical protein
MSVGHGNRLTRARLVLSGFGWRVFLRRYRMELLVLLLIVGLAASLVAVVVLATSGGSASPAAASPIQTFAGGPVPAVPLNHVSGTGTAAVQLHGDTANVSLSWKGLLDGSPHLAHIHGEGLGTCPTAASGRRHNGHLSISTGDAIRLYGPPLVSFTVWGSTSGGSPNNVDMNRYPANGTVHYKRTITVSRLIADLIRDNNAVIVVHGIDYDYNHIYDFNALGVSDLDGTLPGEATAPALCGPLRAAPAQKPVSASAPTTYVASLRLETTTEATWPRVASSGTYSAPANRGTSFRGLPQTRIPRRAGSPLPSSPS